MNTREIVLDMLAAIGANREFWDNADGCQPYLEKAERVLIAAMLKVANDAPKPVEPVWPDAKLEAEMLKDTFGSASAGVFWHKAPDLACHVKALLCRVRDLEAELARRNAAPLPEAEQLDREARIWEF